MVPKDPTLLPKSNPLSKGAMYHPNTAILRVLYRKPHYFEVLGAMGTSGQYARGQGAGVTTGGGGAWMFPALPGVSKPRSKARTSSCSSFVLGAW